MTLAHDIALACQSAIQTHVPAEHADQAMALFKKSSIEPPRDPSHGDLALNAALIVGKATGTPPRELAAALQAALSADPRIAHVAIAGPGFVNLTLTPAARAAELKSALLDDAFGKPDIGHGAPLCVEYVSTNPTGPLHIGHVRGAVFGDALASLLAWSGFDVTREYYVNDAGSQIDTLARSLHIRYRQAHGEQIAVPEGLYPGAYLIPAAEVLKAQVGDAYLGVPETAWLGPVREFATQEMMKLIASDLAGLGISFDVFTSEKALAGAGKIDQAMGWLEAEGLLAKGVLPAPKGADAEEWEPREQMLFLSSRFNDDQDRAVQKSDGAWTYFAADAAYHRDKIDRGFAKLINVFGADHGGYVSRLKATVAAFSGGAVPIDIKIVQLVHLMKNGKPAKMSKRDGAFDTASDLVAAVGADCVRFHMLTRKNDAALEFDFDKVTAASRDNPVYYVQYAHARISSVLKKAADAGIDVADVALGAADLEKACQPPEVTLAKTVLDWPRMALGAASAEQPHRIAFYLADLAAAVHGYWTAGVTDAHLRVIQEDDPELTSARLALLRAAQKTIKSGLDILGVSAPDALHAA